MLQDTHPSNSENATGSPTAPLTLDTFRTGYLFCAVSVVSFRIAEANQMLQRVRRRAAEAAAAAQEEEEEEEEEDTRVVTEERERA